MEGVVGAPWGEYLQKSRFLYVFIRFFFSIFSTHFVLKDMSIEPLYTYLSIYLIYAEGSPEYGWIFFSGGWPATANSRTRWVGKVVPTIMTHLRYFLVPRNEGRCQRRSEEGYSHGCCTQGPAWSSRDPGMSPRTCPITPINKPIHIGKPWGPKVLVPDPY